MQARRSPALTARIFAALAAAAGCGGGGAAPVSDGDADATETGENNPWASCTWEGTTSMATPGVALTSNNSADLTGGFLGETVFAPALQRKKVEVKVDGITPELMTGDAYLVRLTPTIEDAYLIVAIKNISQSDLCLIKATNYRWLAADGTAIFGGAGTETLFVNGGVREVEPRNYTDSCLGPGESGTFTDVKTVDRAGVMLFSKVTTIGMDLTGPFREGDQVPDGRLIPTAYDVGRCATGRSLKVTLTNTGTAAVTLDRFNFSPSVLLDEGGLPLGFLYLETAELLTVAAGGTATAYSSLFMEPRVQRLQMYIDFGPPPLLNSEP